VRRVFISDCEGPISKNDNAFELTAHFVPSGNRLFTVVSRYDDVLADVIRKPGYVPGGTLKLVLPFLKAYYVRDEQMEDFSRRSLVLISNAQDTLRHVRSLAPAFIVSTSYEHYVRALCQSIGFPFENAYCTRVSIDKYRMVEEERKELQMLAGEISQMPVFDIPPACRSLKDLPIEARSIVSRLDEIFWEQIAPMRIGRILSEVTTVGGMEKVKAIEDIAGRQSVTFEQVMYVGDSITDNEAFRRVKGSGGLTVSFNGNEYAVENAEVAILSENSLVTTIVADVFLRFGKPVAVELVESWNRRALEKSSVDPTLLDHLFKLYPSRLPKVKIITDQNMEILGRESGRFRKKVRGEATGRLG
jgi:energy-converting hydrogenase A subunit R